MLMKVFFFFFSVYKEAHGLEGVEGGRGNKRGKGSLIGEIEPKNSRSLGNQNSIDCSKFSFSVDEGLSLRLISQM